MTNDKLADLIVEMTLPPALKVAMGLAGPPPAGGLFHFTSTEGLVGIVTSKSLRASLSSSLNDASEGTYARDLASVGTLGFLRSEDISGPGFARD